MATYLYGLILASNAHLVPAHITGISGSLVRVVACDGLDALVSTLDRAPARGSLDDVRAHDHALQSVVHHGATAAATRFGQSFADDGETRSHVIERGERVARVLEEYDGCVEMRLLMAQSVEKEDLSPAAPTDEMIGPGRAYLEHVRGAGRSARVEGLALRAALGAVVKAERVEELPKSRGVVFSHLVRRGEEQAYREAVTALPALSEAMVVGPLALYSFAEPAE